MMWPNLSVGLFKEPRLRRRTEREPRRSECVTGSHSHVDPASLSPYEDVKVLCSRIVVIIQLKPRPLIDSSQPMLFSPFARTSSSSSFASCTSSASFSSPTLFPLLFSQPTSNFPSPPFVIRSVSCFGAPPGIPR